MRMMTSMAVSAAIIATTIAATPTPAEARGNRYGYGYGGYGYGYGYRHRNRVDAGDIIAGVLVLGTIAAIADSANRNRRDRDDPRYDNRRDNDRRNDAPRYDDRRSDRNYDRQGDNRRLPAGSRDEEGRASDACGWAAEAQANNGAVLDRINSVTPDGSGWRVDGRLVASGYGDSDGSGQSFTCGYRNGRVDFVQLDGALSVR